MPCTILIRFDWPEHGQRIHQMRNFGEDLYAAFTDDGWAKISIKEIDRATDLLEVTAISARRLRRIKILVEIKLNEHFLSGYATVSVKKTPQ